MSCKRLGGIILLIAALTQSLALAEEWSWGEDTETVSSDPTINDANSTSTDLEIEDRSEEPTDRQARFLGLGQKLCALGIGSKCNKKPYPNAVSSHYGPPPALDSSAASSSYATLEYDTHIGTEHGYPSASSKGSAGGIKPFFVPPKPYPSHTIVKPVVQPSYVAPRPSHTKDINDYVNLTSIVQHVHTHTHIHQGTGSISSSDTVGSNTGNIHPLPSGVTHVHSQTGHVTGSGFHSQSSVGIAKEITPIASGVLPQTSFGGHPNGNAFNPSLQSGSGIQVSGNGFQQVSSHSSGVKTPTNGQVIPTASIGGSVGTDGFHPIPPSTPGVNNRPVTGGFVPQTSSGNTFNTFGFQQVSSSNSASTTSFGGGFQEVSQSSSGVIIPTASGGDFQPINTGSQISGTGFQLVPPSTSNVLHSVSTGTVQSTSSGTGFQTSVNPAFGVSSLPNAPFPDSIIEQKTPLYREECQCVARQLCPINDIIPRRSQIDIRNLIDARSRKSNILSNATEVEESEVPTTIIPEIETVPGNDESEVITTTTPEIETVPSDDESEIATTFVPETETNLSDAGVESRKKRDLLSNTHHHHDAHDSDVQERQFAGYAPGPQGCGAHHICCRNPIYAPPKQQYTCGKSNAAGVLGRVKNPSYVNGDAEFAEYPWQAAILKLDQGEAEYVCGAALISDKHVLTAAHCVNSLQANTLKIRLGEWDVSSKLEFYQYVEIPVSNMIIHPEYYAGNLQNDIALMTLQHPVDFTKNPHITPACLPENYSSHFGQRCHSTGWGKDAFGEGGKFQRILKEVEVPIVSHPQCQKALRHTHLGATFDLHEGNICAGGEEGRDTCEGDGGGPLVCRGQDGRAQLVGLVSWGIGCGKVGIPGVYVNVAHYLDWIRAVSH